MLQLGGATVHSHEKLIEIAQKLIDKNAKRRKVRQLIAHAAAFQELNEHDETIPVELTLEPGATLIPESVVKNSTGVQRARFAEAASAELEGPFRATGTIARATPYELRQLRGGSPRYCP